MFGLEGLACHFNIKVVAAAAFCKRRPVNSNKTPAKAVPHNILLRINTNLTKGCVAKNAPQRVSMDTNCSV
jgi:hypothetical protein